jgi:methionine-gamma-lyase
MYEWCGDFLIFFSPGAICGPASLVNSMMDLQDGALMLLGPTMNAKVAFELSERLPHLPLRMQEHSRRALAFATRMQGLGLRVVYPGLPILPHHARLAAIGNPGYGFGGMLCVDMGTEDHANRLMHLLQNTTQFGLMAVSLGYYETLMSCSGSSTSSEMPPEERARAGISAGLIRMSVGYNGTLEQRWAQFERALALMHPQQVPHPLKAAADRDADAVSNNHREHCGCLETLAV